MFPSQQYTSCVQRNHTQCLLSTKLFYLNWLPESFSEVRLGISPVLSPTGKFPRLQTIPGQVMLSSLESPHPHSGELLFNQELSENTSFSAGFSFSLFFASPKLPFLLLFSHCHGGLNENGHTGSDV